MYQTERTPILICPWRLWGERKNKKYEVTMGARNREICESENLTEEGMLGRRELCLQGTQSKE
jgi:hypothetical protein